MTKSALVTGGTRGIGRLLCNTLKAQDWDVLAPTRMSVDFCDAGSVYHFEHWLQKKQLPRFDAVVFCHGEWYSNPPNERHVVDWYRQYTMRVVWPMEFIDFLMCGAGVSLPDSVVLVASTRGFIGGVNTAPYSAACAAQIATMIGYAREYVESGCRFNVVAPGLTDTDMGAIVRSTGGCKPDAVAQPPQAVVDAIMRLVAGSENGKVLRVVDGKTTEARWVWE